VAVSPTFPARISGTSARLVATGVIVLTIGFLLSAQGWLLALLVHGFAARVLAGPTFSPLAQLVTRVLTPWVERAFDVRPNHLAGPPKRFARGVGLGFSAVAALAWLLGAPAVTCVVLAMLLAAPSLEAVFGICLGCIVYGAIWGCADCDDISSRLRAAVALTGGPGQPRRRTPIAPERGARAWSTSVWFAGCSPRWSTRSAQWSA
jgi:hypothetical protein